MKEGSDNRRYVVYATIIITVYIVKDFIYAVIATIIAILGLATAFFVFFYVFGPDGDIRGNKFLRSITKHLKKLRKN